MTAQALHPPTSGLRLQAIAAIIRKDMRTLRPYAIAGAVGLFVMSAFLHNARDWHAIDPEVAPEWLYFSFILTVLLGFVLPAALTLFVILLAQNDAATDTRRDWLVRPVAPLELVAAKAASIFATIVAPMVVGNLIYMVTKGASFAEANVYFVPMLTCCVFVLVLSWLVSTPFQAVLTLLGVSIPLGLVLGLVFAVKFAIARAAAPSGALADPTPFPGLEDDGIVVFVSLLGLVVASAVTLWLLLVRRRRGAARWFFGAYFLISMMLQSVLFMPFPPTAPQVKAAERPASIVSPPGASGALIRADRKEADQ